jgi:hypothetical protein
MASLNLETPAAATELQEIFQPSLKDQEVERQGSFEVAGRHWRTTAVFDTYWRFAQARQDIYRRRVQGWELLSCNDEILATFKFTNVYRAADRVSQYLLREVIYGAPKLSAEDMFFRVLLFKIFNKVETWELLVRQIGEPRWRLDIIDRISMVLDEAMGRGERIYSAAYIMPSGGNAYARKHNAHLGLLKKMMNERIFEQIATATSMEQAFNILRSQPMLGDFLAYQFVTDLNYSELCNFSEQEFVIAGPGARDGLRKCFPDLPLSLASEAIKAVCEAQTVEFAKRELKFQDLWGRPLQLIDCQNLFCEVDKYARIAHPAVKGLSGRTKIKQQYRTKGPLPEPFFPPKWKLGLDKVKSATV